MSVKKKYFRTKPYCKVTFRLDKSIVGSARNAGLAADFNEWRAEKTPMKALKNGDFTVTVDLEKGHEYQYRFVVDGGIWITDDAAEKYTHCGYADCQNAVVVV